MSLFALDVLSPVEARAAEGDLEQLPDAVGLTGRDDEVVREAPVALGVEVAEGHLLLRARGDAADGPGDLARHEVLAAPRALVIEEEPVAREHAVRLAVVDREVEAVG